MNRKSLITQLSWNLDWTTAVVGHPVKASDADQAQNIAVGAIQCINQAGQSIKSWLARRKPRRGHLKMIREKYHTPNGNKTLRELLELAISVVGAAPIDDFWLGALPVQREPQRLSKAHNKALQEGSRQAWERHQQALKRPRKRGPEDEATRDTGPSLSQKNMPFLREKMPYLS